MARLSLKRHPFPADLIRHAVWLYFRFTLSFRGVEDLRARRGISVRYETVRCWTIKFGPQIAAKLRHRRAPPSLRRHLDEMVCNIGGEHVFLWRVVDDEGGVLDLVVQMRCNTGAPLKLLKRLLRNQGVEPESFVTDYPKPYGSALRALGLEDRHRQGRLREYSRPENSHIPIRRRERNMRSFKSIHSAQCFLTAHAAIYNAFDFQRHMISRPTAEAVPSKGKLRLESGRCLSAAVRQASDSAAGT